MDINVAEQSSGAAPGMYEGAKNLVVVGFILDSNMGRRAKKFEMKFVLDLNSGAVKTTLDFHKARLARSFGVVNIIFDLTRFFRFKREKIPSAFHDVLPPQDVYQMLGTFHLRFFWVFRSDKILPIISIVFEVNRAMTTSLGR